MQRIVIAGASGYARVVIDIVEREHRYEIAGLIDSFQPRGTPCFGYEVLGSELQLLGLCERYDIMGAIIAIGDNFQRHRLHTSISTLVPQIQFPSCVHPFSQIARGVTLGRGTVVTAGAIICSNASVGEFCILNTKASLDHDGVMEDFSSLAPGVTTGGNVKIKAFSAIMMGANIIHGVTIGEHSVVGAGATVLNDLPDCVVAFGSPARVVRRRAPGEAYLQTRRESRKRPASQPDPSQ